MPDRIAIERVERKGLFRWHSYQELHSIDEKVLSTSLQQRRRSTSLDGRRGSGSVKIRRLKTAAAIDRDEFDEEEETPLRCKDYGENYLPSLSLSIWLMKWSQKGASQQFESLSSKTGALRMKRLTVNELVGAVYLADERDLWTQSKRPIRKLEKKKFVSIESQARARTATVTEDTMTLVSSTTGNESSSSSKIPTVTLTVQPLGKETPREHSSSSTLEISSLTENQVSQIIIHFIKRVIKKVAI